jgi:hypothetical protein
MSEFHYPISASTSDVWTNCAAAPWMSKLCKQPEPNGAMERGTRIHAIAEGIGNDTDPDSDWDPDEYAYAFRYVHALRSISHEWRYEVPVTHGPLAGTTIDALFIDHKNGVIYVVDLKTGQTLVDPRMLAQLIFGASCLPVGSIPYEYHLGIYQELDDGTPPMRWWCPTSEEITAAIAAMRASIAAAEQGGTPCTGPWCDRARHGDEGGLGCKGKGACGAYKETIERTEFPRATTISPKEAAQAMRTASESKEWHDSVRRTWTSAAQSGQLPGVYTTNVKSKMRWVAGRDLPGDWLTKVPRSPNQIISSGKATEKELIQRGFAVRPPPQVRVRFEGLDEPEELKEGF